MKKLASLLLCAALVLCVMSFGGFARAESEKVVLAMPSVYDMTDTPEVQDAINAITEEKYGISFELLFVPIGNWTQQSNLLLTGDEVDITAIFGTPLSVFVKNGQIIKLDDYYAGASEEFKAVWSPEEMAGTSINGEMYAVPNMRNFGNYFGLNIDAEVAAEMGIVDGQKLTMEDVDALLGKIHEAYPDRYALAPQGTDCLINQWAWDGLGDEVYIGVLPDCGQTTEVQNLFETESFLTFAHWAEKWYNDGYIMADILSNTESWQTMIANKKAVTAIDNYGVNAVAGMIRTVILEPWAVANSYSALCYGINANSRHQDAAWKAMEILYTDAEVENLINLGIEGKHYVLNEDGTASYPEGKIGPTVGYGMAEFYWITPYSAIAHPLDVNGPTFYEDLVDFNKNRTTKSMAFGFSFDISDVEDQYTACTNIMNKYYHALMSGSVPVDDIIAQANAEFEAAGLGDIIAAKQAQLDAYLGK